MDDVRSTGTAARPALAAVGVALVACLLLPASPARAQTSAAVTLAQRYSPVAALHLQRKLCGPGEPYLPTVVNLVLNNPEVVLRDSQGRVVTRAPTARDLSSAPASDYIDLPGNPLNPGCSYEQQFRRWYGNRQPSVYAHVATDSEHPGKLAVQYWFYYTFNDFTDKHESDWEMAQVDFNASTPAGALRTGPYEVDLAQHAGGERATWTDDPKLSKEGLHPVSYVATGSHAQYFQSRLYLGKGGSAIFGCDDTRNATNRLHLQALVVPETPVPAASPYAWLNFEGRWGQKEAGINNGPFGPATHDEWRHPISWAEGLRTSSLSVPTVKLLGVSATSFFCTGTSDVATAINWGMLHPAPFLTLLGVILLALLIMVRRTTWRPYDPRPLRRARDGGQILRCSRRVYREHESTFIGIGVIFIPFGVLAGVLQWLLFHLTSVDHFVALDGKGGAGTALVALLIGGIAAGIAAAAITAAVSAALNEIDTGRRVTAAHAYALAARHARALCGATTLEIVMMIVLTLTVVGIPLAIWLFIRTSLFAQSCIFDGGTALASLRASARLTRGRWWRTFAFTALVDILVILSGPILGVLILLLTSQSLTFIDIIGSLIYALTVPFGAIALTLYYFDLQARPARHLIAAKPGVATALPLGGWGTVRDH
jgi:hypothetical protein